MEGSSRFRSRSPRVDRQPRRAAIGQETTVTVDATLDRPVGLTPDRPAEAAAGASRVEPARLLGLRCRNCGQAQAFGPVYVCGACFGPLEVAYDLAAVAKVLDRATIASRAPGIWRYLELLPVSE